MTYSYIITEVESRNLDSRKKIEHYLTPCYEVFEKIHDLTNIPIHTESKTFVKKDVERKESVRIKIYCTLCQYEKIIAEINPIHECAKKIYKEMQVKVRIEIEIVTDKPYKDSESSCENDDDVEKTIDERIRAAELHKMKACFDDV
jgi:hypothetical protein